MGITSFSIFPAAHWRRVIYNGRTTTIVNERHGAWIHRYLSLFYVVIIDKEAINRISKHRQIMFRCRISRNFFPDSQDELPLFRQKGSFGGFKVDRVNSVLILGADKKEGTN